MKGLRRRRAPRAQAARGGGHFRLPCAGMAAVTCHRPLPRWGAAYQGVGVCGVSLQRERRIPEEINMWSGSNRACREPLSVQQEGVEQTSCLSHAGKEQSLPCLQ